MGLVLAGASAYLLGTGQLAAGGVMLLVSGAMDLLDGAVARSSGRASAFGAFLDSTVDRVSEAVILLGLLFFYVDRSSTLGALLVFVALVGSTMVSYVRARAEGIGVDCTVGIMTRPERVVALGAGLIVGHWWLPAISVVLGVIATLTAFTTGQRVLHVRRALVRRGSGAAAPQANDEGGT